MDFINITEGPGKFGILDAFMHALDKDHAHAVQFTIDITGKKAVIGKTKIIAQVIGVNYAENENALNLVIRINNWKDFTKDRLVVIKNGNKSRVKNRIKWLGVADSINVWYDTKIRYGVIDAKHQISKEEGTV